MTMQDMQATETSVHTDTLVNAPVERAFKVFTEEMASWWHPDHHILAGELDKMVFEPRAGGRIYDLATDGSECTWARVLAFDPPHRLVFSWDISPRWEIETDHAKTSEVEVRFVAQDDETTRVELEHRHLDRHGDGWEGERDAVGSPGGWPDGLRRFADYVGR
jgi:uncharacterized protein YndB with AHSA1/START domain